MKRKIYNDLLRWKNERQGKVAVMIDGARRIGKSYIAEEFARNEYRSYILVDFNNANKQLLEIFDYYLEENSRGVPHSIAAEECALLEDGIYCLLGGKVESFSRWN